MGETVAPEGHRRPATVRDRCDLRGVCRGHCRLLLHRSDRGDPHAHPRRSAPQQNRYPANMCGRSSFCSRVHLPADNKCGHVLHTPDAYAVLVDDSDAHCCCAVTSHSLAWN
ncbi:hypothetical protein EGW08_011634 [Elysia chlorotica]|uniref:Uncharacterized protein n=1 Tax=Elysia chlorotica TaxID=188477 RepID=A0A433TGG5_ELYCH|nr:hypothetical protein EGW08_011634 [Elysia chlorotica]